VTRIPELEQELVAAAARLQSPRRLVRPAVRAALALGAVAVVIVLAVVVAAENDRRPQPAGAPPPPPTLPERQKIARTANQWARLFAHSDLADCKYMTQPACERVSCIHVGPEVIPNCTPPSPAFRLSFARARVEDVETKGNRAAARFSNGERVELERVNQLGAGGGVWLISKFGRNAGREFFR
jgi:hypothetical protein